MVVQEALRTSSGPTYLAATAETPNATDPTRLPTTIHQDRSRGRQRPAPWHTSAHDR